MDKKAEATVVCKRPGQRAPIVRRYRPASGRGFEFRLKDALPVSVMEGNIVGKRTSPHRGEYTVPVRTASR